MAPRIRDESLSLRLEDNDASSSSSISSSCSMAPMMASMERNVNKARRSISFNPIVYVYDIDNTDALSAEQKRSIWTNEQDFSNVRRSVAEAKQLLNHGVSLPFDDETYCTDGVRSDDDVKARRKAITKSILTVLTEQDMQKSEGASDAEFLAELYCDTTYESATRAWEMAQSLASQVQASQSGVLSAAPTELYWKCVLPCIGSSPSCLALSSVASSAWQHMLEATS